MKAKPTSPSQSSSNRDEHKSEQSEQDNMFRNAMKDVMPLRTPNNRAKHHLKKPLPKKIEQPDLDDHMLDNGFSDPHEIKALNAGDVLSFCRDGIQRSHFRKLRGGRYPIAADLDLHGLNSQEARDLLYEFLTVIDIPAQHCALIIHGKGHRSNDNKAILKSKTWHWLKSHERVLAFHSALPADGGTGAVYVILKRIY